MACNIPVLFYFLYFLGPLSTTLGSQVASLRFNANGKFKILQVADMHYANGINTTCLDVLPEQETSCTDLNTTAFLNRLILEENPDLVVFTGDNIFQSDCLDPAWSLDAAFAPAVAAGKPWAAVLGNHDQEGPMNRSEVMAYITNLPHSISKSNPALEEGSVIYGFGNYNLEVLGAEASPLQDKSVLNLYMLDSGDYSDDPTYPGYDWIHSSQLDWLTNVSSQSQAKYRSPPNPQPDSAPALAYFHIPLPEDNLLRRSEIVGQENEDISCPTFNSGFFSTAVAAGDIKALFNGHDHLNEFCGSLSGINLCYAGGFGYHAYGQPGWPRRTRLVEASLGRDASGSWIGVTNITTWKRLDDTSLTTKDVQLLWTPSATSGTGHMVT